MLYKDYIKSLEQLPHKSKDGKSLAATGVDDQTADKIITAMYRAFDDYSVDDAATRY